LLVLNDDDFLALHDSDTGVGGTEIDTDAWPAIFLWFRHVVLDLYKSV
jgi:hypothetical protein